MSPKRFRRNQMSRKPPQGSVPLSRISLTNEAARQIQAQHARTQHVRMLRDRLLMPSKPKIRVLQNILLPPWNQKRVPAPGSREGSKQNATAAEASGSQSKDAASPPPTDRPATPDMAQLQEAANRRACYLLDAARWAFRNWVVPAQSPTDLFSAPKRRTNPTDPEAALAREKRELADFVQKFPQRSHWPEDIRRRLLALRPPNVPQTKRWRFSLHTSAGTYVKVVVPACYIDT